MSAGVPPPYCLQPVLGQVVRHFFVAEQSAQMPFHFSAVLCDQKIAPRFKQFFSVVPRGTDERNTARERLERANRRDSRQQIDVRATRHMQRNSKPSEYIRHTIV